METIQVKEQESSAISMYHLFNILKAELACKV